MVVSINPEARQEEFQRLLDRTVAFLQQDSFTKQEKYQTYLGNRLEDVVADAMTSLSMDTPFENSIELISGQKFPDIIANRFFGVEVKTTTRDHWTTTGNSVMEGTRVDGIEKIYMLFGKMSTPVEFRCRPYEECLSEVVVTHSPRYMIDMNLAEGQTIFSKLKIPYGELSTLPNPVKPIVDYYRQFLKPGEEVWWLDQDEPRSTALIIKSWNNLPIASRDEFIATSLVFFPEVFGRSSNKYNHIATWLVNQHGIVCPNIRDAFTAGGRGKLVWNGQEYAGIPKIILKMDSLLEVIHPILRNTPGETLHQYWRRGVNDKLKDWISYVVQYSAYMNLPIDLEAYLQERLSVH